MRARPTWLVGVLLAACSGSVDVFAFFGLGHAFAGIITGNLVTAGYGLATGDVRLFEPTLIAVFGCVVGEILWAWRLRQVNALRLLIAQFVLLALVLAGWLAAGGHPVRPVALALLWVAAVALGGQSIWALRINQTTTYFTGMLTRAISSGQQTSLWSAARQLAALIGGAALGGLLLSQLRLAAPALPLLFLAGALVTVALTREG
jgi:uncharacterized membrane protein YoaK (UPF0700 family)